MAEPTFPDLLDEEESMDDQTPVVLVNLAASAQAKAAYWQGVAESQAVLIAFLKARLDGIEGCVVPTTEEEVRRLGSRVEALEKRGADR